MIRAAAWNLAAAIALGAFGAHGLKGRISEQGMEWFKTGHSYHMWVAVAWLAVALLAPSRLPHRAVGGLILAGTLFFSGSLYTMAITEIRILGAITPIGGVIWIGTFLWLGTILGKRSDEDRERGTP